MYILTHVCHTIRVRRDGLNGRTETRSRGIITYLYVMCSRPKAVLRRKIVREHLPAVVRIIYYRSK